MSWNIADTILTSRLFLGTSRYPSPAILQEAVRAAQSNVITVSLRRQQPQFKAGSAFWDLINELDCRVLPNTAGCHSAKEAITTAQMAREIFNTHWLKLEVIGDDYTLQPDPFELVVAAKELVAQGFEIFPYCTEDLIVAERLLEAGCRILMPWGSPIGTGKGLLNPDALKTLRQRFPKVPMLIDAGIGSPSQAAQAMEMGFDGVLINSAVATAADPVVMAEAFAKAVAAGRMAYQAGLMQQRDVAQASTPVLGRPFVS